MVTEAVGINETGTIVVIWDWLEGKSKSGQGQYSSIFSKSLFKFLGPVLSAFDLIEILSFEVSALSNSFIYGCLKIYIKTFVF